MRIGLELSPQHVTVEELRRVWAIADDAGFDHVWGFDHFLPIAGDPDGSVLEGWTLLAAMAERTRRTRIGLLVTGNTYRNPGVLAKMAVTVDHLSGGRLEFGLGAGWAEREHALLELPFPKTSQRIHDLGAALETIKRIWATTLPRPVQQPHPPIWVGGSGRRLTLRYVALHADVWNAGDATLADAQDASATLDEHCAAVGRDPGEIRRSVTVLFDAADPARSAGAVEAFAGAGFSEIVVSVGFRDPVRAAELAAQTFRG